MPRESEFTIGVNDEGTSFASSINFGWDSGGATEATLGRVKEFLSLPDVLGEKVELLTFERKGGDNTVVVGPDLDSVKAARDALLNEVGNNRTNPWTDPVNSKRVEGI